MGKAALEGREVARLAATHVVLLARLGEDDRRLAVQLEEADEEDDLKAQSKKKT